MVGWMDGWLVEWQAALLIEIPTRGRFLAATPVAAAAVLLELRGSPAEHLAYFYHKSSASASYAE